MAEFTRRRFLQSSSVMAMSLAPHHLLAASGGGSGSMSESEQLALTATEAVAAIRDGRISAQTYVQTLIARAEKLADLNALITLDKDGALAAASRIDELVASGAALPPLAGLPIVVKDNINTKDLPTSGGTPALHDARPKANAPTLQKLLDAGAIVLGKANMHELAFGITSTNFASFAGAVKNPYDRTRIPGGSSGGTAAAIAARIAPAGLGTDTGGSSRVPAALTGTAGLRPSVGNGGAERRYNDAGSVLPISHTRDTVAPMGRSVADLALLDAVITGDAPIAPALLQGLRIGLPATFWAGLDPQVVTVMDAARATLTAAGVEFVDVDIAGLAELNAKVSFAIALHEPKEDIPAYLAASGITGVTLADIVAQVASPDVRGAMGAVMEDAFGASYPDAINVYRPQMQDLYARYFADNRLDAIMFPTTILPAVPIDHVNGSGTVSIDGGAPVDEFGAFIRNTDPGSNAGIPGLSLHAGMSQDGLPIGLEFDGPLGSDRRLLSIGMAVEALLGPAPEPAV